jgi:hypothetical protein
MFFYKPKSQWCINKNYIVRIFVHKNAQNFSFFFIGNTLLDSFIKLLGHVSKTKLIFFFVIISLNIF